jgi:hypothetical protein
MSRTVIILIYYRHKPINLIPLMCVYDIKLEVHKTRNVAIFI